MRSARQMVLGMAAVGASIALAALLFIAPNYREARDVRARVADLQSRVTLLAARSKEVDLLERELRDATAHANRDLKSIPESPDIAGLIRKLSDQIDGVNVVEQTFTAGTPSKAVGAGDSAAMVMPLAADMRAGFESVVALINKAESMSRLVRVCTLRLQCPREEPKGKGAETAARENRLQSDVPLLSASIGLEVIYEGQEATNEKR